MCIVSRMDNKLLTKAQAALNGLADHNGGLQYEGPDDDVGTRACCYVLSYKPHASDCPHQTAVKAFTDLIAELTNSSKED